MSAVEDKIVSMKFDNKQFDPNVNASISTLDRLKAALNLQGATKGLDNLQRTTKGFSLGPIGAAAEGIGSKFTAMSLVGIAAMGNLVARGVTAGAQLAKSFVLAPIKQGFDEYELKLGSIQTIMAGTGESLQTVNKYLQELNIYSDKTIYSFADMTQSIGKFTNAGVSLKDSVSAIKGIANVAAISGANAGEASRAMYNFAQSLSQGYVALMDWKSIELANMGTKEFKQQLIDAAVAQGTLTKEGDHYVTQKGHELTATKGFNQALADQFLTSKVLTDTLKKYSDETTDIGQRATAAAQDVKTLSQLMGTLKEAVGSGWANTFEILFGNFDEAKGLFTEINNVLGNFIQNSAKARNDLLQGWKDNGGRQALIDGFKNLFAAAVAIVKPIKEAFRQIFPPATVDQLVRLTAGFRDFTAKLKIGDATADKIKRTFAGLFAVFDILFQGVKLLARGFETLFKFIFSGAGGFLNFTAAVGDFLVELDAAIKSGHGMEKVMELLRAAFAKTMGVIRSLIEFVKQFFLGFKDDSVPKAAKNVEDLGNKISPFTRLLGLATAAWKKFLQIIDAAKKTFQPYIDAVVEVIGSLKQAIVNSLNQGNLGPIVGALNTGILAAILVTVKKFLKNGFDFKFDFGSNGVLGSIKQTFDGLTSALSAMQAQIHAKTLMSIAIAIGVLTASIVVLSGIDGKELAKSMAGIGTGMALLVGAMGLLDKVTSFTSFIKMPFIAASLISLAAAMIVLSAAVKMLSGLSWEELGKGLSGVGAMLGIIVAASYGLDKANGPLLRAGAAMIPLAIGIKILAGAIKDMSGMSWEEIGRGMTVLVGSLGAIALAMKLMPKDIGIKATAMVVLAASLKILASALGDMGDLSVGEMTRSLIELAGALVILAGGLKIMSGSAAGAATLVIAATALRILTPALQAFGDMSMEEIGKSLGVLAGGLVILAGGLAIMKANVAGAAALLIAAFALQNIGLALAGIGKLGWPVIIAGLTGLAVALGIIGVAAYLLTPVVPVIDALGAAIFLLGAALGVAGAGALAFATAFAIFAAAGTAGIAVMGGLIGMIPVFMANFAAGIAAFIISLAENQGKMIEAGVKLIGGLLEAIVLVAPAVANALTVLVGVLIKVLLDNVPRLSEAGLVLITALLKALSAHVVEIVQIASDLIVKFLQGISNNIGRIVKAGTDVVLKFMDAIQKQQGPLLDKGAKLIIDFVNKLADTIRKNQDAMRKAGRNLASAIIEGMAGGIKDMVGIVVRAARDMALAAYHAAKDALDINSPSRIFRSLGHSTGEGLVDGMDQSQTSVARAGEELASSAVSAASSVSDAFNEGLKSSLDFRPVITPQLDMSNISSSSGGRWAAGSGNVNDSFGGGATPKGSTPFTAQQWRTFNNTRTKAEETFQLIENAQKKAQEDFMATQPIEVRFEQNNNSPKALNEGELYMETKSLLGQLKGALNDIRK